jgi:hypothetical protein
MEEIIAALVSGVCTIKTGNTCSTGREPTASKEQYIFEDRSVMRTL